MHKWAVHKGENPCYTLQGNSPCYTKPIQTSKAWSLIQDNQIKKERNNGGEGKLEAMS